ncbi:uncharacterized protein LOC9638778 isoform X1 [Selaginella moellendorffii]|nr:uncharacterized protein LOC9638778 isoform X1 [Selaginella moellendorffii]|eukprot:XP_002977285.2 uncharacterized protein LOC9638778 isoform X1 [Selaginella moellendorffii]
MATPAALWWESHRDLFEDLEDFAAAEDSQDDGDATHRRQRKRIELEERLLEHQNWLIDMLLAFKRPNAASNQALKGSKITVGSHSLDVKPELQGTALGISKHLDLDEIQSYILLSRHMENNPSVPCDDPLLPQSVAITYFLERQCLLKCTRLLLTMQCMSRKVQDLIDKDLGKRALENLNHVVTSTRPEQWDSKFSDAWADEIVSEESLLMDILFMTFSDSRCSVQTWKDLFVSFQFVFEARYSERLAVTSEAEKTLAHVRSQALLILIEVLDLRLVLTLVHGEISFSQGGHGFSADELQELDVVLSGLDLTVTTEYAPLLLAWATFICLVSSLPDQAMVLDIEHAVYAQQAFKYGAYAFLLKFMRSEQLKDSDVSFIYNGSVKTLSAACIAAYEFCQADITSQNELIELLCETYDGQEWLCTAFWDKEVAVDGPIRSFLYSLRDNFPQEIGPLLRLLSCLCEGRWSAECVYNFLCQTIPVICLYRPNQEEESFGSVIHISSAVQIPNCSGLYIPAGAVGRVLKRYNDGVALVRWECEHSALVTILSCLAQWPQESVEGILSIVSLLNKMLSSNKDISLHLVSIDKSVAATTARADGRMDRSLRIDVISLVCSVIKNLVSGCPGELKAIAESVSLLQKLANSFPGQVMAGVEKTGLIQSSDKSIVCGEYFYCKLSKLEQSSGRYCLTLAVLDAAILLLEKGVRTDSLSGFVIHSMHSILVNYSNWKFKERHERWCMSAKIYQMLDLATRGTFWHGDKLRSAVLEEILNDTVIHSLLFQILTVSAHKLEELYTYRLVPVKEVDTLLQAICAALCLINTILEHHTDAFAVSPLCQFLFHKSASSTSVITIITSYFGFQRCTRLQILSARILGKLCEIGQKAKPQAVNLASYISGVDSKRHMRDFIERILSESSAFESPALFDSILSFVTSAISWQPGMLELLISPWIESEAEAEKDGNVEKSSEVLNAIWNLLTVPTSFSRRYLEVFSRLLSLLLSIWQGGSECLTGITVLRNKKSFWETLSNRAVELLHPDISSQEEYVIRALCRRCQASIFQIMIYDMFIQSVSRTAESKTNDLKRRSNVVLSDWISSTQLREILSSYVDYDHSEEFVLQTKREARCFVIGLLVKLLSGDNKGMDVSFTKCLLQRSSQILSHPSFKELVNQYSSRGYSYSGSIELLVMSDLYYNLQGDLHGRTISNRHFQDISNFLADIELDTALIPPTSSPTLHEDFRHYDVNLLRSALGLEFWDRDGDVLTTKVAENVLYSLEKANDIIHNGAAHISAVTSLVDVVKISGAEKKSQVWTCDTLKSLVERVCVRLERTVTSAEMDRAIYVPKFVACQSKLLEAMMWQILISPETNAEEHKLRGICATAITTSLSCIKSILDSQRAKDVTLKDLFGCLLVALEVMSAKVELTGEADFGAETLSFLPMLCGMVENKDYRCLALAAMNMVIRFCLVPSTWIPILQAHFPTKSLVSSMALGGDDNTRATVMSFCLYLSCFKSGAEMLFTAGFLHSISLVSHRGEEDYGGGPFSISMTETSSQQAVWALGVAAVASLLRALGDNDAYRGTVLDTTISYFKAERHKILLALCSPNVCVDSEGRKVARYHRAQTSSSALQEAQYVTAFLCEIIRHPIAAVYTVRDELVDFREMAVHLLAYVAREGLVRSATGEGVSCPPLQRQETVALAKAATLGGTSAWFLLTARGSHRKPHSATGNELDSTSGSEYSESIAIQVYRLANLLLRFLVIQARQALQDMEEGRSSATKGRFPELPAPEILHALQDQVMLVASEIATSKAGSSLSKEAGDTCCMLLSILEKSLYLEACIFRVCGVTPVSLRADDFARDFKALLRVTAGHASLEPSLAGVREIASTVYPGL